MDLGEMLLIEIFGNSDERGDMLEIQRFARKPFFVDAVQVTAENMGHVANWCMGSIQAANKETKHDAHIKVRVHRPLNERQTMAFVGDWVLYAGTGFKVYSPRAFEKNFEAVPDGEPYGEYQNEDDRAPVESLEEEKSVSDQQAEFAKSKQKSEKFEELEDLTPEERAYLDPDSYDLDPRQES